MTFTRVGDLTATPSVRGEVIMFIAEANVWLRAETVDGAVTALTWAPAREDGAHPHAWAKPREVGDRVGVPIGDPYQPGGWLEPGTIVARTPVLATIRFDRTVYLPAYLGDGAMIECEREWAELEDLHG